MLAPEFIEKNPKYFDLKIPVKEYWLKVRKQAARHTRRSEKTELYDISRPNETEVIKNYREKNKRHITIEIPNKFISKSSRIFKDSGVSLDSDSISEKLKKWLDGKPFFHLGRKLSLWGYFYDVILKNAIESPNDILIAFPVVASNPNVAPATPLSEGGFTRNDEVVPVNKTIPIDDIVYLGKDIFSWEAGIVDVQVGRKKQSHPFYFIVDAKWYYQYKPVGYDTQKKEVIYKLLDWYMHDTGRNVANILGGRTTSVEDGQVKYFESYLHPAFELGDEVIQRFSDGQAVSIQHSYPHVALSDLPCDFKGSHSYSGCVNGKVKVLNSSGVPLIDNGKPKIEKCPRCDGQGKQLKPNPYGVFVKEKQRGADVNNKSEPVIEYYAPPGHMLEFSYTKPFDLFERAKQSVSIDMPEGINESGYAKELRLQSEHDLLAEMAFQYAGLIENFLYCVESILVVNARKRKQPKVFLPSTFKNRDLATLKEDAQKALPSEKFSAEMQYYAQRFKGDERMLKVQQLYLSYTPFSTKEFNEVQSLILNGTYDDFEIYRKDFGVWAFNKLSSSEKDFLKADELTLFKKADELIRQRKSVQSVLNSSNVDDIPQPNSSQ